MRISGSSLIWFVTSLSLQSCVYNVWDFDRCDIDALGCAEGGDFQLDPSCTLTGDLAVEVGQGELSFQSLGPGEAPEQFFGAQGGYHIFIAFRVRGVSGDYPRLQIRLDVEQEICPTVCEWEVVGEREVVLGPDLPQTSDGLVEQAGLAVIVFESGGRLRIRVDVLDPCNRRGEAIHEY